MNNPKNTNKTFAQATENSTPYNSITNLEIGNETPAKMLTCLLHVHVMNAAEPGVFNKEANKLFKLNDLPAVKLPQNPPSIKLFRTDLIGKITHNSTQPQQT